MKNNSLLKLLKQKKTYLFIAFAFFSFFCNSQNTNDSLFKIWHNKELPKNKRAEAFNNYISKTYLEKNTDSAYILVKELQKFTFDNELELEYAQSLITLGNVMSIFGDYNEALDHYKESLSTFKTLGNKKWEAITLNNLGKMYKSDWDLDEALNYYEQSLKISETIHDSISMINALVNIGNVYNIKFKVDKALEYYEKSIVIANALGDQRSKALIYINIGHNYSMRQKYAKAVDYLTKSISISKNIGNTFMEASGHKNLAQCYFIQQNYDKLIEHSLKSLELTKKISNKNFERENYYFIYEGYKGKKKFEEAVFYMEKMKDMVIEEKDYKLTRQLQKFQIEKIKTNDSLLRVQKTFENNLKHQVEIQEKNNLIMGFGGGLLAISVLGFISYRNTKRKQLIAEQEKEIEIQKKTEILKNLELQTIDAMIEGQEKERQRIANDLHDDLGSLMTNLKWHFETLKNEQSDAYYEKTNVLLDDAYKKIRSIAHAKNAGVIAKEGLLKAVKNMAGKISQVNKLTIEVFDHGLENRLENSLELTIFRITQELVANVIRHAYATEINIHLTNHDDSLNIMVEDNGIGFNPSTITKNKKGMGLSSIEKRVEHLGGTMTIETELKKGTSIIIDLPL